MQVDALKQSRRFSSRKRPLVFRGDGNNFAWNERLAFSNLSRSRTLTKGCSIFVGAELPGMDWFVLKRAKTVTINAMTTSNLRFIYDDFDTDLT